MQTRPTLLNSCARAATSAEARFRVEAPIAPARATRVMALDDAAAAVARVVAEQEWASARFYTCQTEAMAHGGLGGNGGASPSVALRTLDGSEARIEEELLDADSAVMIATVDDGATCASTIGRICSVHGIMTAGLVLGEHGKVGNAVAALRPYARVLMVSTDKHDVADVLTALRA